jgi:hypothetical protein
MNLYGIPIQAALLTGSVLAGALGGRRLRFAVLRGRAGGGGHSSGSARLAVVGSRVGRAAGGPAVLTGSRPMARGHRLACHYSEWKV